MKIFRFGWILLLLCPGITANGRAAISPIDMYSRVHFADINADGKLDAFVGNLELLKLYLNTGTLSAPAFNSAPTTFSVNPALDQIAPCAGDIDLDGDLDLLFGTSSGTVGFYRNTGTAQAPAWTLVNSGFVADTYGGISVSGSSSQVRLIDLDGDGDLDMTLNSQTADMFYYFNQDRESDGWVDGKGVSWVAKTSGIPTLTAGGNEARHEWFDYQSDGDFDLISGTDYSKLIMFVNNGSPTNYGSFTQTTPSFNSQVTGQFISPCFEDFTADGFMDLYYTNGAGSLTLVSAITRVNAGDTDTAAPVMAVDALKVDSVNANNIILKWPYVYDSAASTYRSGVKSYTLYRADDPADFATGGATLVFKHHQFPHLPDTLDGFAGGSKFKIEGGSFYYYDARLPGGSTYYYKLVVADFAGNQVATTNYAEASHYLAPSAFASVSVTLTPATAADRFTLTVRTLDQYGQQFPVNTDPGSGDPNVEFAACEGGSPSAYPLLEYIAGSTTEELHTDSYGNESEEVYSVTYRPDQGCISFTVRVKVTHWLNSTTSVSFTGNSSAAKIDRVAPPLPSNLRALDSEITLTSIKVRWDASTDACSSTAKYKVYYRTAGLPGFTFLTETTNLYYLHAGLTRNTDYSYYVTAVDVVNNETVVTDPAAVALTVRTKWDIVAPSVPTGASAIYNYANTQVTISWTASTDDYSGVGSYEVQRKDGTSGTWTSIGSAASPATSYVDSFPWPGHNVYYKVRAADLAGNTSAYCSQVTAVRQTDTTAPSVPAGLAGTAGGPASITLTWNASTDTGGSGVKSYKVYRGAASPVLIGEVSVLTFTDTNLVSDTDYIYQLSATDNAGNESAKCTGVTVRTLVDAGKPNPPRNLRSIAAGMTTIRLAWDAPEPNDATVSFYRVYIHATEFSPDAEGVILETTTATVFQVIDLTPGTTYYYSVTAVSDTATESNHSSPRLSVTTSDTYTPPFPRLGMWWPDTASEPPANIARYDWVIFNDGDLDNVAAIKALNPSLLALNSTNACELSFNPEPDAEPWENQEVRAVPPQWFLTQVGTTLQAAVNATATVLPVQAVTASDGANTYELFVAGDTVLIEGESVYVESVNAATRELTVRRGYVRPASSHAAGVRVASHITFWPDSWLLNVSTSCPAADAGGGYGPETWAQYNARVAAGLLQDPDWDGILLDRSDPDESWLIGNSTARTIDPDQSNTLLTDYSGFDTAWNAGLRIYEGNLRAVVGYGRIVFANWGMPNYDLLNGNNLEGFPDDAASGWNSQVFGPAPGGSYFEWVALARQPNLTMIETYEDNSAPDATGDGSYVNPFDDPGFTPDYRKMRFGLTTALMSDGFFSYEINTNGHGSLGLMWFDEYDNAGHGRGYLGQAQGPARRVIDSLTGPNLVSGGGFETQGDLDGWDLWADAAGGYAATVARDAATAGEGSASARVDITQASGAGWRISFQPGPVSLAMGADYTLIFWAKADRARSISAWAQRASNPWDTWLEFGDFSLTTAWQRFEMPARANGADPVAELVFGVGQTIGSVWLDGVELRPGSRDVWRRDYANGTVLVNGTASSQTITLGGVFRKISGVQEPLVNDGHPAAVVTLPAADGLILLAATPMPGDLNNDGVVNALDIQLLANHLAGNLDAGPRADVNLDSHINAADLTQLKALITP